MFNVSFEFIINKTINYFSDSICSQSLLAWIKITLSKFTNDSTDQKKVFLYFKKKNFFLTISNRNEDKVTRNERLFLDQYRYDIRVGVPFVALFSIPIIGYSAPLLAILGPKYLPSTLIMPKQKVFLIDEKLKLNESFVLAGEISSRRCECFFNNY